MDAEFLSWTILCILGGIVGFVAGKFYVPQQQSFAGRFEANLEELPKPHYLEKELQHEKSAMRKMEAGYKEEIEQLKQRLQKLKNSQGNRSQDEFLLKDMSVEIANLKANSKSKDFLELDDLNSEIDREMSLDV